MSDGALKHVTEHGCLRSLTGAEIEDLLRSKCLGHLGCAGSDGVYVVPITFAYDRHTIYAHSRMGHKIRTMRRHPKVCLQVEEIQDMFHWKSVMIQGRYEELSGDNAALAMRLLVQSMARVQSLKMSELEADFESLAVDAIFYRIEIESITGRGEDRP